jgi:hypothetical protein
MSQNKGRKMPMMNMTQWPFLIVMTPRVINRTRYRMMPPPIQISTANLPFVLATRLPLGLPLDHPAEQRHRPVRE